MKADRASTGMVGIGAGFCLLNSRAFDPDKSIRFQYTGGPQPVARGAWV